jgi:ubiquinone/menaquinone biosynthesis C-methylase UbiE
VDESPISKVRELYDSLANIYDELYGKEQGPKYREAIKLVGKGAGRLLDIGCGTGGAILLAEERGWNCIGLDVSVRMLKKAKKKVMASELVQGSLHAFPFRPSSFNAIVSITSFSSVEEFLGKEDHVKELIKKGIIVVTFVKKGIHNRSKLLDRGYTIIETDTRDLFAYKYV